MKNSIEHKPLPSTFKGRGSQRDFSFTLIKREGDVAIYEKVNQDLRYQEVVVVRKHDGRTMPGGVKVEPSEFYPSDDTFGLYGWCFQSDLTERIEKKFHELINRKNNES